MITTATPTIELATDADLAAIRLLRLAQGWSATDEVGRAVIEWERGRVFVIRASALAAIGSPAQRAGRAELAASVSATAGGAATDPALRADAADAPVVVTAAIAAGAVGVIGSVIVRDDYQRRGLGRYIMGYALDWLRAQGVRAVSLDATPAGRPLYTALGFEDLGVRSWFTLTPLAAIDRATLARHAQGLRAASVDTTDAGAVASALNQLAPLDSAAFGGDRMGLIAALIQRPNHHLYIVDDPSGAPAGYLVAYPTGERYHGLRVGPWVATSQSAAAATLLAALQSTDESFLQVARPSQAVEDERRGSPDAAPDRRRDARDDGPQMVLSLPGTNPQALDLLRAVGCELVLDDMMMRLNMTGPHAEDASAVSMAARAEDAMRAELSSQTATRLDGDPTRIYAWMASMVF